MSTRETKAYFPFVTQKCQHKDEINFRFGNILGTDSMTSSRDYHNLQEVEGGIAAPLARDKRRRNSWTWDYCETDNCTIQSLSQWENKYGTVQELRSTFSHTNPLIVILVLSIL